MVYLDVHLRSLKSTFNIKKNSFEKKRYKFGKKKKIESTFKILKAQNLPEHTFGKYI
jgi:hypothetical protein